MMPPLGTPSRVDQGYCLNAWRGLFCFLKTCMNYKQCGSMRCSYHLERILSRFALIHVLINMPFQAVQASFVVEEWVDQALSKSCEVKGKLEQSEKAVADSNKRLRDTIFHLAKVEKGCKNAESALARFERQAEEARLSLQKAEMQLALVLEKTKQLQKQLEEKDAKRAKVEQAVYDASITKTTQSLTAQLRDVARAFYVEVQGEAFNATRVSADFELRGANKIYYPRPLQTTSSPTFAFPDPSSTSSAPKLAIAPAEVVSSEIEKEQQPPSSMVELGLEEAVEVEQLKRKKK